MDLSVIIPTCPNRAAKLRTLLEGIAATESGHDRFEVVVVVDDEDEAPLALAELLPSSIAFRGLTKPQGGPARARNYAMQQARGKWVLFYDDDVRVAPETIPAHLARIADEPDAPVAHLGRSLWPPDLLKSPWQRLLSGSSMIFFWDSIEAGQFYNFRYFWTSNLSVRKDLLESLGGFCESFPYALHEDIEMGWRLEHRYGLRVRPMPEVDSWHDHEVSVRDYFNREYRGGVVARIAEGVNLGFFQDVWGWMGDLTNDGRVLRRLFDRPMQQLVSLLESWEMPSGREPSQEEKQAVYLAHLPLKRLAFCWGYAGEDFEELWTSLGGRMVREITEQSSVVLA